MSHPRRPGGKHILKKRGNFNKHFEKKLSQYFEEEKQNNINIKMSLEPIYKFLRNYGLKLKQSIV